MVDLQTCVKAQQSRAYARKVKLSNLQRMAWTVAWIQENGIRTLDRLTDVKESTDRRYQQMSSQLHRAEADLRLLNRKIRHVGRYYSNRKVYARYEQAQDRARFREERRSEIEAYEESVQELKTLFPDGDYPSLKELKATKAELMEQRDKLRAELKMFTVEKRNLDVVWKNVQAILGRGRSIMAKQRSETPWNHSRIRELEL